jgi:hypothetical protein
MLIKRILLALLLVILIIPMLSACKGAGNSSTRSGSSAITPVGITGTISTQTPVTVATGTIGATGGVVSVTEPGNPLTGLELNIPANAYSDTRQVKISYAPIEKHTFGKNFNPITPLITIENCGGYSNELISIKVPVKIPSGTFAMAFFYNNEAKKLEGVPVLSQDADTIAIAAMQLYSIVFSYIDEALLNADIDSKFKPAFDDWEFENQGSYISQGGHCAGQSISALWYYCEKPDGADAQLFGRYDNNGNTPPTPGFDSDDSLGYRFASMVQSDINWSSIDNRFWSSQRGLNDELTWKRFAYSILLTGQPQLVSLASGENAHAMIVYRVVNGTLHIADPNYPGNPDRKIEYSNGKFTPYNSGMNADDIKKGRAIAFEKIGYRAKTAAVDWTKIQQHWNAVKNKSIGNKRFPSYSLWYGDKAIPNELKDNNETTRPFVGIGGKSNQAEIRVTVYRDGMEVKPDKDGLFQLKPGGNLFGVRIDGKGNKIYEYIDFKYVNIDYKIQTSTTSAGKLLYKLQGLPAVNHITQPSASGVSATISTNSATYVYPDPDVIKVTQTVSWEPPTTFEPGQSNTISFKSSVAVVKADEITMHIPKTGVESWQQAREEVTYPTNLANPFFRIITTFSVSPSTVKMADMLQYSPDNGKTWKTPVGSDEAWQKYYEPGMKQTLQPILVWAKHVNNYLPPSTSKPLPLSTPPEESLLQFRLKPDYNGPWPDKIVVVFLAEATGLTGGGGNSIATAVCTYQKQ